MEILFQLQDVSLSAANISILRNISMSVPLGATSLIMGPAGGGKSSLIKILAGLNPPDAGSVTVNGRDYSHMSPQESQQFRTWTGFVFQDAALWANQSVLNNVMMPLLHHAPYYNRSLARTRAIALIRRMGYNEDVDLRPSDLSAGEQKLISFARAMIMDPMIHFMDAPLDMIDTGSIRRVINLIQELKRNHRTLIIVSDRNDLCCEVADYVYILKDGELVDWGDIASLAGRWPDCLEPLDTPAWNRLEKRGIMKGQGTRT